jgi:hypothetical protein
MLHNVSSYSSLPISYQFCLFGYEMLGAAEASLTIALPAH